MNKFRIMIVSVVFVCTGCVSAFGEQPVPVMAPASISRPDSQEAAPAPSDNLGDEPVDAGDLVYISVTGAPELTRSYRISKDDQLILPLVKEPISVAGMVPPAVAHAVTAALVHDKILVAPIVSATVLEYQSREVTIAGEVKAPTTIQATGHLKLLDALTRAQGISPGAGPDIVVTRPSAKEGGKETIRIPVKELYSGQKPDLNIALAGNEVIRVPEAPKLLVIGNVRAPGVYPLTDPQSATVLKAMAVVQGTLPSTNKQAHIYRVVEGSEKRKVITIPLQEILDGKSQDVQLQANDILYIPVATTSPVVKVLEHLLGFGESVGSGLIIGHGI